MTGRRRHAFFFLTALVCASLNSGAGLRATNDTESPAGDKSQVWKGTIKVPGMPLDFVVRLKQAADESWSGTIDIPAQGAKDLALSDVGVDSAHMKFTLPVGAPAVFNLKLLDEARRADGNMDQHGQSFEVSAERITEAESADVGPKRPQTPKPPFPYPTEDVTFRNDKEDFSLAGTLAMPKGKGPFPALVMITGSGTQDRDETLFGHKPFLVIADHLARRGIATLRYDDRGAGGSKLPMDKLLASTSENLADDARAAVDFLRKRKEIDPKRIGLIGHSEGGMIAPMIAAEDRDIACIVLLAGTALPGRDILSRQLERISLAAGIPKENVDRQLKAQAKWMKLFTEGAPEDEIRAALRELVEAQLEASGQKPKKNQIDEATDQAFRSESNPWMKFFIAYDPRTALKQVTCPVLAMNGSLDTQVLPDDNLPALRAALEEAGNKSVSIRKLPGLNHLFQRATSGLPGEYSSIEETFSPKALKAMSTWLRKQMDTSDAKKSRAKKRVREDSPRGR